MPDQISSRGIRLRHALPDGDLRGAGDACVTSCSADWRTCRPGDLFVAVAEDPAERQADIAKALSRGAVAIVTRRGDPPQSAPTCLVDDVREALGHICQALAGRPSQRLNVIGITGSRGKTITSHLIAGVLSAGDYCAALSGSLACCDGLECGPPARGTPTAPMLAAWLRRSAAHGSTHAVLEISRCSLDESRIAGISLDMACVTNVALEPGGGNVRARHVALAKIFAHLLPEGMAVLNADDESTHDLLGAVDTPAITIGLRRPAEISATVIEQTASDQTFLLSAGSDSIPVRTPLIGTHNVYNCLFAAAVGFGYGLDLATIARGLESIACVAGRLEPIRCGQPFGVFVDDACEPDRLSLALSTLRNVTRGRLRCVFSPGERLDRFGRMRLGRVVGELTDQAIVTRAGREAEGAANADVMIDDVLSGCRRRGQVAHVADRQQAIRSVLTAADEGDCVLIAGGASAEDAAHDAGWRLDDSELARDLLHAGVVGGPLRAAA